MQYNAIITFRADNLKQILNIGIIDSPFDELWLWHTKKTLNIGKSMDKSIFQFAFNHFTNMTVISKNYILFSSINKLQLINIVWPNKSPQLNIIYIFQQKYSHYLIFQKSQGIIQLHIFQSSKFVKIFRFNLSLSQYENFEIQLFQQVIQTNDNEKIVNLKENFASGIMYIQAKSTFTPYIPKDSLCIGIPNQDLFYIVKNNNTLLSCVNPSKKYYLENVSPKSIIYIFLDCILVNDLIKKTTEIYKINPAPKLIWKIINTGHWKWADRNHVVCSSSFSVSCKTLNLSHNVSKIPNYDEEEYQKQQQIHQKKQIQIMKKINAQNQKKIKDKKKEKTKQNEKKQKKEKILKIEKNQKNEKNQKSQQKLKNDKKQQNPKNEKKNESKVQSELQNKNLNKKQNDLKSINKIITVKTNQIYLIHPKQVIDIIVKTCIKQQQTQKIMKNILPNFIQSRFIDPFNTTQQFIEICLKFYTNHTNHVFLGLQSHSKHGVSIHQNLISLNNSVINVIDTMVDSKVNRCYQQYSLWQKQQHNFDLINQYFSKKKLHKSENNNKLKQEQSLKKTLDQLSIIKQSLQINHQGKIHKIQSKEQNHQQCTTY